MNLNEEYGLDAFCQGLIANWPEVSLTLKRAEDKVFVTAGALGHLAIAVSRTDELAGSCVRRAVTELHAKLVVADQAVAAVRVTTNRAAIKEAMLNLVRAAEQQDSHAEIVEDLEVVLEKLRSNPAELTTEEFELLGRARHIAEVSKDLGESVQRLADALSDLREKLNDDDLFDVLHDEVEEETDICVYDLI